MHKFLNNTGKLIVVLAAAWAVGGSLYIFFSPVTVSGVTGIMSRNSNEVVETFTRNQSWYEAQGLWGVLVPVIFSGLYLLSIGVAWRGNYMALAIVCVTMSGQTIRATRVDPVKTLRDE